MNKRRLVASGALLTAAAMAVAACGGGGGGKPGGAPATVGADPAKVSGDITVLTHRTDMQADGTLAKYAADFNKIYPNVHVKFEAITAYEPEVKIRMNTSNYGDVLMIPSGSYVSKADYPKFFSALGSTADLAKKYRFTDYGDVNGQTYGIAINGNANGFVYNKAVWAQAGITSYPTSPQAFLAALQAIRDKTSSTPYYTNYHDGWPVGAWTGAIGSPSCDVHANDDLATDKAPWAAGKDLNVIDTLLYDIVHGKLAEEDPTTTNWEGSKGLLANGKIATMWLGSWAVSQMQDAARKAGRNPDDIGFMPFPVQHDGHFCSVVGPDFLAGISIHSQHKEAARAWLDWFTDKSPYAQSQGDMPTLRSGALPATLQPYQQAGVQFVELTQDRSSTVTKIDNAAEIGLTKPDYRQHLVDAARGAGSQSLDQIFADLNRKWSDAVQEAGS
jgi:raffinose/stachyose/melibiose transport system substrate-binding protein